jgi:putative NADH-flavin reductase
MRIAILGAAGNVGQRIVREALGRGHEVTALGPHRDKLEALQATRVAVVDMTDAAAVARELVGHDVVVSAVRFVRYESEMLLGAVRTAGMPRLAIVGGAGSLHSPAGGLVADGPNFPEGARPEAAAGTRLLDRLQTETRIDWTFLSPSAVFVAGERTGRFRLGDDDLLVDADGKSEISFEDLAIAILDEIEAPAHSRRRFTVGY